VLRNSIAWQSFIAQIQDAKSKMIVNNKVVKTSYTLLQFLAMPTLKKLNVICPVFGG
jgi:hypothetical protein